MRIGIAAELLLAACGSAAAPPRAPATATGAPAATAAAVPAAWTTIPAFDLRIGCAGNVLQVVPVPGEALEIAVLLCEQTPYGVGRFTHHATLDDAIDNLRADSGALPGPDTHETRTAHAYRLEFKTKVRRWVLYSAKVAIEIDGEAYTCDPPDGSSPAEARANAEVCMTLSRATSHR